MSWVAYMPLRGGSKSIPRKNTRLLAGRPLFSWALGAALECGCFDEFWVGTDSDLIEENVRQIFEDRVRIFRRSPHTCTDEASTESAQLEFAQAVPFSVLCTIQATSPLTTPDDFRRARRMFEEAGADSLLTATRVKRFFWCDDATPLNYDPCNRPRRQDSRGTLMENGAFYITRRQLLEQAQCRLGGRISIYEMSGESATEIDEPDDWTVVERLLRERTRGL